MKNEATWEEFLNRFESILKADLPETPYDNKAYFNYLKLNESRQRRWLKTSQLIPELLKAIQQIKEKQTWYIITEPWCGDAAHSIPFLYLMTQTNEHIELKMIWRDTPPFMIEDYLTNGGKSVPKLIVRDADNQDIFTWGPRPTECQKLYLALKEKNADFEEMKITLQQWYNNDKGQSIQNELLALITSKG
jgi:hypothetical protein